jgi:hypothetical protein
VPALTKGPKDVILFQSPSLLSSFLSNHRSP